MKKIAVLLADGFEETEALATVDILRRAHLDCRMISLSGGNVRGSHGIEVIPDEPMPESFGRYDMIVLPGGLPGAANLRDDDRVVSLVREMHATGKWVAAICAAPIVLGRAGLLNGRSYTCYPGFEAEIAAGAYTNVPVVVDGTIITGRGPGAVFDFAYQLVDALDGDSAALKKSMLYV